MSQAPYAPQNRFLAALPEDVRARLWPHFELVQLTSGKVLYESGDTPRHVYFPVDAVVSLLYVMRDGASAEICKVGNEGLIGVSAFMSGQRPPSPTEQQMMNIALDMAMQKYYQYAAK